MTPDIKNTRDHVRHDRDSDPRNLDMNVDRELLCALFDGELESDSARFALNRLAHDADWRQACGRWQLTGDVLRGQAVGVAPAGFAEAVARAVGAERMIAVAPVSAMRRPSASRRRWVPGAALAASVAMAALFVANPFSNEAAPDNPAQAMPQVAATTPASTPAPTTRNLEQTPGVPAQDPGIDLAAAAVAVAEVPRRAAERRSRAQSQRAAQRSRRTEGSTALAAAAPAFTPRSASATPIASAVPDPDIDTASANPFRPQPMESASRPWPRAALPDYPANGAFTASYGSNAATPSFYPFEPQATQSASLPGQATSTQSPEPPSPQP